MHVRPSGGLFKKSLLPLITSSHLLISEFLDLPHKLVTTDKWEVIARQGAECHSRQNRISGVKDPLGDVVLSSWVLKPEEETHRLTREGTGFGSLLSFRLDFDGVGRADASGARFPQPA